MTSVTDKISLDSRALLVPAEIMRLNALGNQVVDVVILYKNQ